MSDGSSRAIQGSALYKKWNLHDIDFVRLILRFHFHGKLRAYDIFGKPHPASISKESAQIISDSSLLLEDGHKTTAEHLQVYVEIRKMFEHWRFHAGDVASLENEIPNLAAENSVPPAPQPIANEQPARKKDRRTLEWGRAVPIAQRFYEESLAEGSELTLKNIKSQPEFRACFVTMPSDDTIRGHLNNSGVKLRAGRRPQHNKI